MTYKDCLSFLENEQVAPILSNIVLNGLFSSKCSNLKIGRLIKKFSEEWNNKEKMKPVASVFTAIMNEPESQFYRNNTISFDLKKLYAKLVSHFEKEHHFKLIQEFFNFALCIRLITIIRTNKIPLVDPQKITKEVADKDFKNLEAHNKLRLANKPIKTKGMWLGQKASNFFMHSLRLSTAGDSMDSPLSQWNDNSKLIRHLRNAIRYMATGKSKELNDTYLLFNTTFLRHEFTKKNSVSQYRPSSVVDVFFKLRSQDKQFEQLKKLNVSDLTSGWGDRLVGFLSIRDQINYYFLNDLNQQLIPQYKKIIEAYAPNLKENIDYTLSSEPAQKLDVQKIIVRGKYHYSVYGLPFYQKEKYAGSEANEGLSVAEWFDNFFIPLMNKVVRIHDKGGYCVLNLGNYQSQKPTLLIKLMNKEVTSTNIELLEPAKKVIAQYNHFLEVVEVSGYDKDSKISELIILKRTDAADDSIPKPLSIQSIYTFQDLPRKADHTKRYKKGTTDSSDDSPKRSTSKKNKKRGLNSSATNTSPKQSTLVLSVNNVPDPIAAKAIILPKGTVFQSNIRPLVIEKGEIKLLEKTFALDILLQIPAGILHLPYGAVLDEHNVLHIPKDGAFITPKQEFSLVPENKPIIPSVSAPLEQTSKKKSAIQSEANDLNTAKSGLTMFDMTNFFARNEASKAVKPILGDPDKEMRKNTNPLRNSSSSHQAPSTINGDGLNLVLLPKRKLSAPEETEPKRQRTDRSVSNKPELSMDLNAPNNQSNTQSKSAGFF